MQSPPAVQLTVPPLAEVASKADTVRVSPSGSVSLASTSVTTALSSAVTTVSSLAVGKSFTGFTVTVTVAVSHKPPSSHTV